MSTPKWLPNPCILQGIFGSAAATQARRTTSGPDIGSGSFGAATVASEAGSLLAATPVPGWREVSFQWKFSLSGARTPRRRAVST